MSETPTLQLDCQPVREGVSYRGLFTAGWFGVREKHCSRLEIYDRLRASEQGQATDDCIAQRCRRNRCKQQNYKVKLASEIGNLNIFCKQQTMIHFPKKEKKEDDTGK